MAQFALRRGLKLAMGFSVTLHFPSGNEHPIVCRFNTFSKRTQDWLILILGGLCSFGLEAWKTFFKTYRNQGLCFITFWKCFLLDFLLPWWGAGRKALFYFPVIKTFQCWSSSVQPSFCMVSCPQQGAKQCCQICVPYIHCPVNEICIYEVHWSFLFTVFVISAAFK